MIPASWRIGWGTDTLWVLPSVRIDAVSDPFTLEDADLVSSAMDALLFMESMGLLSADVDRLDRSTLLDIAETAARAGIAQTDAARLMSEKDLDPATVRAFLERLGDSSVSLRCPSSSWLRSFTCSRMTSSVRCWALPSRACVVTRRVLAVPRTTCRQGPLPVDRRWVPPRCVQRHRRAPMVPTPEDPARRSDARAAPAGQVDA